MYAAVAMLVAAIGLEVGATAVIPRTNSFHHLGWSAVVVAGYVASTFLLSVVVKTLPLGVTYAAWAGLGTVLVCVVGYLFQGEPMSVVKAASIAMNIAGVVSLNTLAA